VSARDPRKGVQQDGRFDPLEFATSVEARTSIPARCVRLRRIIGLGPLALMLVTGACGGGNGERDSSRAERLVAFEAELDEAAALEAEAEEEAAERNVEGLRPSSGRSRRRP
jgi:hypothetical protein